MWELACLRRRSVRQFIYRLIRRLREQARSHLVDRVLSQLEVVNPQWALPGACLSNTAHPL
ncbi:hypothetical protein C9382_05365 [Pseudomonas aylmerensis]|uniref:Uncharacterized protein n=1 Tax=Pseudomonas aylmerensis TaxID=1869229 RepID=A0A2T4G8B3_9PSED|nr:hypothetical protein C9382_05365 [Pseudomonas aylmerensis]